MTVYIKIKFPLCSTVDLAYLCTIVITFLRSTQVLPIRNGNFILTPTVMFRQKKSKPSNQLFIVIIIWLYIYIYIY